MRHLYLTITAILLTISLSAQRDQTIFGGNGLRLSGFWFGGTSSMQLIDGENDIYRGGHFAFEFNNNWLLGWSHFDISTPDWELDSHGAFLGYSYNANSVVHPTFNISIANAKLSSEAREKDRVWTVVPAAGVELNVVRWFRLGMEAGYRFASDVETPGLSDADISGGFGTLRLRFGWSWK